MKFSEIQIGERFTFRGMVYTKTALSCAEGPYPKHTGNVFLDYTEVEKVSTAPEPVR